MNKETLNDCVCILAFYKESPKLYHFPLEGQLTQLQLALIVLPRMVNDYPTILGYNAGIQFIVPGLQPLIAMISFYIFIIFEYICYVTDI